MAMNHANLLTLITPLNAEEAEAFASNQDKVGIALLQAIQDAGAEIAQKLTELKETDQVLYAEAMMSFKPFSVTMG